MDSVLNFRLAKRCFSGTIGIAFIFFLLFWVVAEFAVRSDFFLSSLTTPRMGGQHGQFEFQLHRLDRALASKGQIDCIFLGNSMVWRGLNPSLFQKAYSVPTGQNLQCFNFGVDAMPAAAAGEIAQILIHDYQPKLLIYGTDARDYAVPPTRQDTTAIRDMPWVRYRMGAFSLEGVLFEYSYAYRYKASLRHLLRFDRRTLLRKEKNLSGFDPEPRSKFDIRRHPSVYKDEYHVKYYYEMLSNYRMLPQNLEGLDRILRQNTERTRIVLVEMPVPQAYMHFFKNGRRDHQRFVEQIAARAAEKKILFVRTSQLELIPDDGWVDYSHLNTKGAQIFSSWLASKIGALTKALAFNRSALFAS